MIKGSKEIQESLSQTCVSVGSILGDCLRPEADITWSPFDVNHEVINESSKDRVKNQPSEQRNATKIQDSLVEHA